VDVAWWLSNDRRTEASKSPAVWLADSLTVAPLPPSQEAASADRDSQPTPAAVRAELWKEEKRRTCRLALTSEPSSTAVLYRVPDTVPWSKAPNIATVSSSGAMSRVETPVESRPLGPTTGTKPTGATRVSMLPTLSFSLKATTWAWTKSDMLEALLVEGSRSVTVRTLKSPDSRLPEPCLSIRLMNSHAALH
jgi:hypothetical protein